MTNNNFSKTSTPKIKRQSSVRRWLGFGMTIFSLVVGILCIFPGFLGIGYFFYGVFGVGVWPLLILTALSGLAFMRNLNFTASSKYIFYIVMSYISVLCLFHLIFSTNVLSAYYLDFSHMKAYLASSFGLTHGVTAGGVLLSIFIFAIRAILGVVGSYVVYVISASIFIGLAIDYVIYNKAIDRRKKIYNQKHQHQKSRGRAV